MAAVALAPLLVGVLICVLVAADQWQQADLRAQRSVRGVVADAVTRVRTEIRNELAAAGTAAGARTVAAAQLARGRISVDTAVQARDSGTALLDDTARPPSIIVPVFRPGAAPATTAQRRASITAYRIVPLALEQPLSDLVPDHGGLAVLGPTHTVTAVPSEPPADSLKYAVDMDLTGSPGWRVQAWSPAPGIPGVTWFWIIGLLAVFFGISLATGCAHPPLPRHRRPAAAARARPRADQRPRAGAADQSRPRRGRAGRGFAPRRRSAAVGAEPVRAD